VFVNHEGDMFRTRLTHSIEVAQIGRTIARALRLNDDLVEAVCLAHDLGHTPFGHAGQHALNACMREFGGFEHNLQSLRVVDVLEEKYTAFCGLNLTFETREGILKHCPRDKAAELGEIGARFVTGEQPSLEAQIANFADEIAYNNHDVDDGLRSGLIDVVQLNDLRIFADQYHDVTAKCPDMPPKYIAQEVVRRMINEQVIDLIEKSAADIEAAQPRNLDDIRMASKPLISFSEEMQAKQLELRRFLRQHLYEHYRVHRMGVKAGRIIRDLFDAFMDDPEVLPPKARPSLQRGSTPVSKAEHARAVADYIAGMTDRYAIMEHKRIFEASELT
jgi:dGTPase